MLKAIAHCRPAVVFAGLLWAATTVGAGPGQRPTYSRPGSATFPVTKFQLGRLEKQMFALVNHDRQDLAYSVETHGQAQPLKWNDKLAAVARAHSLNMAQNGYFDHTDPDGTTFSTRIIATGIPWQAMAENIASNPTVTGAEASFMREPPFKPNHRANILSVKATDIGIGIMPGPNGNLLITQDFVATPPASNGGGQ
jgi:uncharacterized protein YkwD